MSACRRIALLAAALAVVPAFGSPAMATQVVTAPVVVQKDSRFGAVLFTHGHKALYWWSTEKRAGGKIRCTGSCAALWPPLIVRSVATVPKTVPGVKGTFGVIKRPNGKLQVTFRGLALYAYLHDGPNQVLCDNVDGWFVARAR
jgi:predicted lipoprotein with Yx(FWY)xxD motif